MTWARKVLRQMLGPTYDGGCWSMQLNQEMCEKKEISPTTGPRCPEGSRKLRFPDYVTVARDVGKVKKFVVRFNLQVLWQ